MKKQAYRSHPYIPWEFDRELVVGPRPVSSWDLWRHAVYLGIWAMVLVAMLLWTTGACNV